MEQRAHNGIIAAQPLLNPVLKGLRIMSLTDSTEERIVDIEGFDDTLVPDDRQELMTQDIKQWPLPASICATHERPQSAHAGWSHPATLPPTRSNTGNTRDVITLLDISKPQLQFESPLVCIVGCAGWQQGRLAEMVDRGRYAGVWRHHCPQEPPTQQSPRGLMEPPEINIP